MLSSRYLSMRLTTSHAPQVRFALGSSATFSRNDKLTDSERFYKTIVDFLESPSEHEEVTELLRWWNRCYLIPSPKLLDTG